MNEFLLLVVFAVATTCTAYDFRDSSLILYIFEDFKNLSDKLEAPHSFRFGKDTVESGDSMRKREHMLTCCNYEFNPKQYELYRKTMNQCFKEIVAAEDFQYHPFKCGKLSLKVLMTCASDCFTRKLELADPNGDMNREAFIEYTKEKFSYPGSQWKFNASEEIVNKCLGQLQSSEGRSSAQKCNPSSLKTDHCLWQELLKACPKTLQVESNECNRLREKLEKDEFGENIFI